MNQIPTDELRAIMRSVIDNMEDYEIQLVLSDKESFCETAMIRLDELIKRREKLCMK